MNVRLLFRKAPHHARRSGYHGLAAHVAAEAWRPGVLARGFGLLMDLVLPPKPADRWYPREFLRADLAIAAACLLPGRRLYHFLDGEDSLRLATRVPWRWGNRLVATFHQPPALFAEHFPRPRFLAGLDAAVVLSREQEIFFQERLQPERVVFIPHGVDAAFWCPDPAVPLSPTPLFLAVGSWLRDLDLLGGVAAGLAARCPAARLVVVAPPDRAGGLAGRPNVELRRGLADEELRDAYRRAWALLLPLKAASANNALLEAMACGTGAVATAVGGVSDYVTKDSALTCPPGDAAAMTAAAARVSENRELAGRLGAAARARALELRWEAVGERLDILYCRLLGRRPEGGEPAGRRR